MALATDLLSTDERANALQVLGKIAKAQNRTDDAVQAVQEARQLHRQHGDHLELARDDQFLGNLQAGLKHYAEALQTLDECLVEAVAAANKSAEGYCRLAAARVLTSVGYFDAAELEIDRASRLLSLEHDLAQVLYARGNLHQEIDRGPKRQAHQREAVAAFEQSLELARRTQLTGLLVNIHLNLAYSLAELGKTEDADRHLAEAAVLDRGRRYEDDRALLAARIAYRRGNLSLASSLNERVYPKLRDDDDQIDVSVMQARIALATNDLTAAVLWARRGVESAERIRAAQSVSELRPWVLASRREPFELLLTALARGGSVDDAVRVFDQWQGRTMLDDMARPSPEPSRGLTITATQVQSLGRWLPTVSKAPLMARDDRAIGQALARIDLIALAVAEGDVWRLTASHGRPRLDNLGSFEKIRDLQDHFITEPTDHALANELGAVILPEDVVRRTDEPLYVVLDAPFAALPFAALRKNGQPLIAARPMIRAPRMPVAGGCRPRNNAGTALVLADAKGDLPDARRESSKVASMFGTTPLVGPAATSTALFAATSDALLHVAVHAGVDDGGGSLSLYDRAVPAPEISASKLGPPLVVLSGCSTARSADPEIARSLATAFLASGSERVIATLRPVLDSGALEVTNRFYDARGADDPVRVLAKVQAELAQTANQEWPNFAVFGSEICSP